MIISFERLFKQAAEYCNYCFLNGENRINFQSLANNSLAQIIDSCDEESKDRMLAEQAIKICRNCDYRDPKIFQYLERSGIKFY